MYELNPRGGDGWSGQNNAAAARNSTAIGRYRILWLVRAFSDGRHTLHVDTHSPSVFCHQAPHNLDVARRVVAQEKLDILVYPDIGMEALTYFMAFARLAPVQVSYLTQRWFTRGRG